MSSIFASKYPQHAPMQNHRDRAMSANYAAHTNGVLCPSPPSEFLSLRCADGLNRGARLARHVGVSADPVRWAIRHAIGAESRLYQSCSYSTRFLVQAILGE
jgi:hypothetical protein